MAEMELRWVTRISYDDPGGEGNEVKERVLQYRLREGPRGEDWWGSWKEVPDGGEIYA